MVVLVAAGGFAVRGSVVDEPITIRSSDTGMVLASIDGASRLDYEFGPWRSLAVRAVSYDSQRMTFSTGAFRGILSYVTDQEYRELKAIQGCKADFLNQHAKVLALVPKDEHQVAALKQLSISEGDKLTLRIAPLEVRQAKLNGYALDRGQVSFSGLNAVAVDDVRVLK